MITPTQSSSEEGRKILAALEDRFQAADTSCQQTVTEIIVDIQQRGDTAIIEYTRKFDAPLLTVENLRVTGDELEEASTQVSSDFLKALHLAAGRVRAFHEREVEQSWFVTREDGTITGRLVRPVGAAGLYVPGGQAGKTPLVSSVLMNGIPAAIAGLSRKVMVTPPDENGKINPALTRAPPCWMPTR